MRLYYCLKCARIVDRKFVVFRGEDPLCPTCRAGLTHFGREAVTLSPEEVLAKYDKNLPTHAPKDTFTGESKAYSAPDIDVHVLECEDTLRFHPNSEEALLYLGIFYKSQGKLELAYRYLIQLMEAVPTQVEACKHLTGLYLGEEAYDKAIALLKAFVKADPSSVMVWENLSRIHYRLGEFKQAVDYLVVAYEKEEDEERLANLYTVISSLFEMIEKKGEVI
jgi:tetratricopeptide (TPR) repeat protein